MRIRISANPARPSQARTRRAAGRRRLLALPVVAGLALSACSMAPSGAEALRSGSTGNGLGGGGATIASSAPGAPNGISGAGGAASVGSAGTAGIGSAGTASAPGQSGSSGPATGTASVSSGGGTNPGGVIKKKVGGRTVTQINVVFPLKTQSCGSNPTSSTAPNLTPYYDRIQAYVNFFNKYVLSSRGYMIKYYVVDDGGSDPSCADVARAGAIQAVSQDHAFAVLNSGGDCIGSDPELFGDIVAQHHVIYIGSCFQYAPDIQALYPYVWGDFNPASDSLQTLSWYVDKRVKGTNYSGPPGVLTPGPRKYALVFPDDPMDHDLANQMVGYLRQVGVSAQTYYLSPDAATAGQQAPGLVEQMISAGVNTVVTGLQQDPAVEFWSAAQSASYYPTILVNNYGFPGPVTYWDNLLMPASEMNQAQGVATPAIQSEINDASAQPGQPICAPFDGYNCQSQPNASAYITAYKQGGGTSADPQNGAPAYTIFTDLAMLAIGVAHLPSGAALTPAGWAQALAGTTNNACETERYWGVWVPQAPITYANQQQPYLSHGFTTLFWNGNGHNRFDGEGYFESYDGFYRFNSLASLPNQPSWNTEQKQIPNPPAPKTNITVDTNC